MATSNYRDSYFLFGSACRLLSGKIAAKDGMATLEQLWQWSKRKVDELNHDAADVPHFDPPAATLPPEPVNGNPEPSLPPPAEKPVKAPDPSPVPQEKLVADTTTISDVMQQRFVSHCRKHGMSEIGIIRWLRDNGINGVSNIPLGKAKDLWERVRSPETAQQYR